MGRRKKGRVRVRVAGWEMSGDPAAVRLGLDLLRGLLGGPEPEQHQAEPEQPPRELGTLRRVDTPRRGGRR